MRRLREPDRNFGALSDQSKSLLIRNDLMVDLIHYLLHITDLGYT